MRWTKLRGCQRQLPVGEKTGLRRKGGKRGKKGVLSPSSDGLAAPKDAIGGERAQLPQATERLEEKGRERAKNGASHWACLSFRSKRGVCVSRKCGLRRRNVCFYSKNAGQPEGRQGGGGEEGK